MHELGIATETHRLARARLAGGPAVRLARVWMAVGELSAVDPELLRFAWEAVTDGGPDAGCALEIRWCPSRQVCGACGEVPERAAGEWRRACPRCGEPLRIEGGDDLDLLRLDAEPLEDRHGAAR